MLEPQPSAALSTSLPDSASPLAVRAPRRLWRWLGALGCLLLALVISAPYVAARAPFRDWILGAVLRELNGSVVSSGATFDWFRPVALYGLEIHPPEGPAVLVVPAVEGDTPLWRLIVDRGSLGVFRIERPQVEIVLRPGGSTVRDVLAKIEQTKQPEQNDNAHKLAGGAALGIDLVDASLVVRRVGSDRFWTAREINLSARIERAEADQDRELVVAPGRVLNHITITPEVCDDFLKFMAPTLAQVTRAGGAFSLDLERCRLPLERPREGDVVGKLTLHEIKAGPGPMVEQVATMFGVPGANQLANEQVVLFELRDQRVYHRDLKFNVGPMGIGTEGFVSLPDQKLELTLAVRLPEFANRTAPLRGALSGETLNLPIRGTLAKPELDRTVLRDSGLGLLSGVLNSLLNGEKVTPDAIERGLRQGGLLQGSNNNNAPGTTLNNAPGDSLPAPGTALSAPGTADSADATDPTAPRDAAAAAASQAIPILEELLRQRAANVEKRRAAAAASAENSPPPEGAAPPPTQRPIRRRARQLLDNLSQPPADTKSPPAPGGP
jgi:hypothetical protein